MLSHDDEQRLAAIEQQLLTDDPALARLLGRRLVDRRSIWQSAVAAAIGILCALSTVAGLLANSGALIVSSAALTAAAAWVFHRARRSRRRPGRPTSG